MSREIKFRGWDGEALRELDPDRLSFYLKMGLTVNQYTGLKDRDGKEIYEGDILEYEAYDGSIRSLVVTWDSISQTSFPALVTGEYYEIIGNIYTNPELLVEGEK